jgi:hypothetical protein
MPPVSRRALLTTTAVGVSAMSLPDAGAHASSAPQPPEPSQVALASYVFAGAGHLEVDGTSAPDTGFDLGVEDFTVECWFRLAPRDRTAGGSEYLFFIDYAEPAFGFGGYPLAIHLDHEYTEVGSESVDMVVSVGNLALNTSIAFDEDWHHVGLMRISDAGSGQTTHHVLIDGDVRTSFDFTPWPLRAPLCDLVVGARLDEFREDDDGGFVEDYVAYSGASGHLTGSVSNLRILRGSGSYALLLDGDTNELVYTPEDLPLQQGTGVGVTTPVLLRAQDLTSDEGSQLREVSVAGTGVTISGTDVPPTTAP